MSVTEQLEGILSKIDQYRQTIADQESKLNKNATEISLKDRQNKKLLEITDLYKNLVSYHEGIAGKTFSCVNHPNSITDENKEKIDSAKSVLSEGKQIENQLVKQIDAAWNEYNAIK